MNPVVTIGGGGGGGGGGGLIEMEDVFERGGNLA